MHLLKLHPLGICFNDINSLPKPLYCVVCVIVKGNGAGSLSLANVSNEIPVSANLVPTAGNSQVTLAWDAVTDVIGYNVKRSTTAGGPYTTIASNTTGTSYVDNDVINCTTYYYVVTAVTADGESANSNEASATPVAPPIEDGEAVLRVTMINSSEREYQLTTTEIDGFINWVNHHTSGDPTSYMLSKSIGLRTSKEYLLCEKIISFEVTEIK